MTPLHAIESAFTHRPHPEDLNCDHTRCGPGSELRAADRARGIAGIILALTLSGCGDGDGAPRTSGSPPVETGPFVSVAVDNHFHDIHPEDHKTIAADRAFEIRNEGRNLHNVTIIGTEISRDVRPGKSLTFDPVGDWLEPGTYQIICKYHDYVGMTGEITIVD